MGVLERASYYKRGEGASNFVSPRQFETLFVKASHRKCLTLQKNLFKLAPPLSLLSPFPDMGHNHIYMGTFPIFN